MGLRMLVEPWLGYTLAGLVGFGIVLSLGVLVRTRGGPAAASWAIAVLTTWVVAAAGSALGVVWALLLPWVVVVGYGLAAARRLNRRRRPDLRARGGG
jgi:hypothetical protein